jgi:hypothetical protein
MKKNQKIKNAGSPPGGIQPYAPGWLPFWFSSFWFLTFLALQNRRNVIEEMRITYFNY